MKTKLIPVCALVLLLTTSTYAQDTTNPTDKDLREQERTERKARIKEELQSAGQQISETASDVGQGAKEKAKVASEALKEGAGKVGDALKAGWEKAEVVIEREGDKLKARRDSIRARKAQRDTL